MKIPEQLSSKFTLLRELFAFFWERKLWWMIPMLVVLLGLGLLIIFAQSSAVVPFIYVLF